MEKKYNAVFEGGGVRGIAHVGAAGVLEKKGFRINNTVGSSAGAIIAALYACGYTSKELKEILEELDFAKFKQEGFLSSIGVVGKTLSVIMKYGIYNADYFEAWLNDLLKRKNITKFKDLKVKGEDTW